MYNYAVFRNHKYSEVTEQWQQPLDKQQYLA